MPNQFQGEYLSPSGGQTPLADMDSAAWMRAAADWAVEAEDYDDISAVAAIVGRAQVYAQLAGVAAMRENDALSELDVARGFLLAVTQINAGKLPLADVNAVERAANLSAAYETPGIPAQVDAGLRRILGGKYADSTSFDAGVDADEDVWGNDGCGGACIPTIEPDDSEAAEEAKIAARWWVDASDGNGADRATRTQLYEEGAWARRRSEANGGEDDEPPADVAHDWKAGWKWQGAQIERGQGEGVESGKRTELPSISELLGGRKPRKPLVSISELNQ